MANSQAADPEPFTAHAAGHAGVTKVRSLVAGSGSEFTGRYGRGVRWMALGRGCWLAQPAYLLVELLVAAGASAAYSLRDDTISALGMLTCAPGHVGSPVDICSPWHVAMNAGFLVFGLLRAAGAVLLRAQLGRSRWASVAVWLWVVSGLATAGVGLFPVDHSPGWHAASALTVFLLQPFAVLATARALQRFTGLPRSLPLPGNAIAVVLTVATIAFGARMGASTWVGALERLALWPTYPWLAVVAWALSAANSMRSGFQGRESCPQMPR
ncbi:MAG: DUF998 domain-containing protein [Nonomuraea sp.]|nr:DUF998 domain-containing protein [Nonomuraea sp.]